MIKLRSFVLAGLLFVTLPLASSLGQVGISVNVAPPVLPVIEQPPCPVEGYIWTPGYWGYGASDYYWVPGGWVAPPTVGVLWTPPWWGWNNGAYAFNQGYWGPTVGYYGGINYGYGYNGNGYWGGRWEGNAFRYNTAVTRVNTNVVHNTYVDRNVVNNQVNANRASFNGPNGVKAEATAEQKAAAANAKKMPATSQQLARQEAAAKDRNLQASVNKGHPNSEAIKSFNKGEGAGQGKGTGAEGAGPAAGAGKAGNKPGAAGAGQAENKRGNMSEHNRQGAGAGNLEGHGNKVATENHGSRQRNLQGNQNKAHGKMAGPGGGAARGPHTMAQRSGQPKMAAHGPQMGGKHPQTGGGGNRPHPTGGQQQGKKKPGQP
jgi:WXXGXW repeat (2 copies)